MLPLSIAGRKPDQAWLEQLIDTVGLAGPPHPPALRALRRPAAAGRGGPGADLASPPSSSPTSRPATSTRRPREDVLRLLRQAVDEFGQTVVMVTHDPEAAAYADRLLILRDGEIVHDAAPGLDGRRDRADEAAWLSARRQEPLGAQAARRSARPSRCSSASRLIAGTYVLTDTINKAFDQIFSESLKGTAVVITVKQPVAQETGDVADASPPRSCRRCRRVPGVELAAGHDLHRRAASSTRTARRSAPSSRPSSSPRRCRRSSSR